jgi:hypothetical protein
MALEVRGSMPVVSGPLLLLLLLLMLHCWQSLYVLLRC